MFRSLILRRILVITSILPRWSGYSTMITTRTKKTIASDSKSEAETTCTTITRLHHGRKDNPPH